MNCPEIYCDTLGVTAIAGRRIVTDEVRVSVVCCLAFGERLRGLDLSVPIWIVRSEANNPVLADVRRAEAGDITAFEPEQFVDLLETVNEYHWDWTELEVHGVKLDEIEATCPSTEAARSQRSNTALCSPPDSLAVFCSAARKSAIGTKQTSQQQRRMSAFDPKQTKPH